jgi:hypothetical protein
VKWSRDQPLGIRIFDQPACLRARRRERLVDDDVLASLERLPRKIEVRLVRCGDHDQVDVLVGQQLGEAAHGARLRIGVVRLVALALDERRQPQAGDGADKRRMKDLCGKSKANDSYSDFIHVQVLPRMHGASSRWPAGARAGVFECIARSFCTLRHSERISKTDKQTASGDHRPLGRPAEERIAGSSVDQSSGERGLH